MEDLKLLGYSRKTNFTFEYDYTLILSVTSPPADILYTEIILGVVCDEKVLIDGELKKDHIQSRHSFKIRPQDFVSWKSEFTIRGLCVNKFYSNVRESFYQRIIKTLSN
jgi:hypothetical protein